MIIERYRIGDVRKFMGRDYIAEDGSVVLEHELFFAATLIELDRDDDFVEAVALAYSRLIKSIQ